MATFELTAADGRCLRGDRTAGKDRQLLFITGFLSTRWGTKSKALAQWCAERGWGFCCFDFRGWGDSDGALGDYRLTDWLDDARAVMRSMVDGTPVTIVGNSLGGWLAWLVAQEQAAVEELILIAPAFNMMGVRAEEIPAERSTRWHASGSMPWDDEPLHLKAPIPWSWVEDSRALWAMHQAPARTVKTTILHGLQDTVIKPAGSWAFVQHVLTQAPQFPIELYLMTGDHRLSGPQPVEALRRLVFR